MVTPVITTFGYHSGDENGLEAHSLFSQASPLSVQK